MKKVNQQSEQDLLAEVAKTVTQEPITLDVDIRPRNWIHRYLQEWGWMPKKRHFIIDPIYLGSLIRISKYLLAIEITELTIESTYKLIATSGQTLARVVAVAIQNNREKESEQLVRFIEDQFTPSDLITVAGHIIQQMNLSGFMTSIISIRGSNILQKQEIPADAKSAKKKEVSP